LQSWQINVIQVRVSDETGHGLVDLLSVPANQTGYLMPHAQSAGATQLPTRLISKKNGHLHG
jgi:hypothetical protein